MPEVDLNIIANNQEFLKSINEAKKAEGDFYADWQKNMNLTAEQHESIMKGMQDELKRLGVSEEDYLKKYKQVSDGQKGILEQLQEDLRIYKRLKESATTTEDIEKFNKKIKETQKEFDKLNGSSKKSTDTFDKLKSGFVKLFAVIGGGYAIMQGIKKAIASTGDSADWFNKKLTQAKYATDFFLKSLVSGDLTNFSRNLDNVIAAAGRYADKINEIKNLRRSQEVQDSAANIEVQKLLKISDDVNNSYDNRIDALKEASRLEKENINVKTKLAGETLKNELDIMSNLTGLTYKQLDQYIKEYSSLSNLLEVGKKYNELLDERNLYQSEVNRAEAQGLSGGANKKKLEELNIELEKMGTSAETAGKLTIKFGKETEAEYDKLAQAYKDFNGARAESDEKTRRMEARLANLTKEREDERLRKKKETDDKIKKQHEEFLKLAEDLNKRYQDAQLEGLTGKKRINAEEDFALLELSNLKANLEARGKLTKEQLTMIEFIETSIAKKGVLERKKIDIEEQLNRAESKRGLLDTLLANAEDEIDLTRLAEEEKLKLKITAYEKTIQLLNQMGDTESLLMAENLKKAIRFMKKDIEDIEADKTFSVWKFLGIDENSKEGKQQIEGIQTFTDATLGAISQIMGAEAELAAQRRQVAEERLNQLESQLEEELDLQEQGLANNVNAVKKEIEQTKAEKQKAQEQEKQIQQAQMALDTVTQVSSLITASTKIFKATAGILPPFGQILAIAAIGTMFSFMAAAKIKAAQAAKMEQGGFIDQYGVIQGKRHSEGGEPLTKHVEVEQGEGVGVFNRNATQYYGGMLPKWVQSINNRNFPKFDIKPEIKANQTFDLKTSTMNSELKAIRAGIDNLNHNIQNQSQTNHKQGVRIEKQGNRTRIIHESN